MAGLLGALVAGGVKGYTSQRLEDINEQEKFDFAKSLQDSQFEKEELLKEMGFKQDVELQGIRKQDAFEQTDYQTNKNVELKKEELRLANEQAENDRSRIGGYFKGAKNLDEASLNAGVGGDLKSSTEIASLKGKREKPVVHQGNEWNPETGKWSPIESDADGEGGSSGKSKSSKDKNYNKEMMPVIKEVKESVLSYDGMSELDQETQKMKPTKNGLVAQGLAERLLKANPDFATQSAAEIAHYAVTNPDNAYDFKAYKQADGSVLQVPVIKYKGQLYEMSNAPESISKPKVNAENKDAPRKPPAKGLLSTYDDAELDKKAEDLGSKKAMKLEDKPSEEDGVEKLVKLPTADLRKEKLDLENMLKSGVIKNVAKAKSRISALENAISIKTSQNAVNQRLF